MLRHLRTRTPLVAAVAVLFLGIFASGHWGLYDAIPHFDKLMHLLGGLTMAWLAVAFLQEDVTHLAPVKQALIFVSVAVFVGVLWELAEYLSNLSANTWPLLYHYFHGGNLADTLADLVCDMFGAVLLTSWVLYRERN